MANFDLSFLNPKLRKSSSTYSFLVDQLSVKENQLASDGKLSPGDYNYLISEAQKLSAHPGLTPDQRSAIGVKISGWQKDSKVNSLSDQENLTRLDNESKDDNTRASMVFANDPEKFIATNIASTRAQMNALSDNINNLQNSGGDASAHILKYNDILNTYNDLLQAQSDIKNYQSSPTGKPGSDFAAYISTNSQGQVTNIKIGKAANTPGYSQTYGLYGGLPIYGNAKLVDGKQVFKIGNNTFSAVNVLTPDPNNPGSFTTKPLSAESSISGLGGGITMAQRGGYVNVDPKTIRSQTIAPAGSYVKGSKGFIYQANEDGTYKKIMNSNATKLGLSDADIPSIPADYEKNLIIPRVTETVDASLPPPMPTPPPDAGPTMNTAPTGGNNTGAPVQSTQPQANARPTGTRVPTPTTPASDAGGVAKSTQTGALGFLGRLFGVGQ